MEQWISLVLVFVGVCVCMCVIAWIAVFALLGTPTLLYVGE